MTESVNAQYPTSISPDGARLVFTEIATATAAGDVLQLGLDRTHAVTPLVQTPFNERNGEVSPDGRWLAYEANNSGPFEIYVRPFPDVDAGGRWQPSSGGGTRPVWARNGQELFYLDLENRLTAVPVQTSAGTFAFGSAAKVLDTAYAEALVSSRPYDVSADGKRFLMVKDNLTVDPAATPGAFVVVLNWFDELKAKLSAGR